MCWCKVLSNGNRVEEHNGMLISTADSQLVCFSERTGNLGVEEQRHTLGVEGNPHHTMSSEHVRSDFHIFSSKSFFFKEFRIAFQVTTTLRGKPDGKQAFFTHGFRGQSLLHHFKNYSALTSKGFSWIPQSGSWKRRVVCASAKAVLCTCYQDRFWKGNLPGCGR